MKKHSLYVLLAITALYGKTNAQSVVMLQHGNTPTAFYGNAALQQAYNASGNGDTIYLPGGYFEPPPLFDKRLAVFGAGHHPDSSSATLPTIINGNITLGENADSSSFTGFTLTGSIASGWNASVSHFQATRLMINGGVNLQGDRTNLSINGTIRECIIASEVNFNNCTQFTLTNNIIQYRLMFMEACMITNNIFLGGDDVGGNWRVIYYTNQSVIRNNVFHRPVNDFFGCSNNFIQNNVFTNTPPVVNNTATGNYYNVNAANIFVSYANDLFKYTNNYHLQTPASFPGTDGLQAGIYGSAKPWKEGSVPLNPHIQFSNIAENTDSNGQLQIQVRVAAQNQ